MKTIILTEAQLKNLEVFLTRAQLTGVEVGAFQEIIAALVLAKQEVNKEK